MIGLEFGVRCDCRSAARRARRRAASAPHPEFPPDHQYTHSRHGTCRKRTSVEVEGTTMALWMVRSRGGVDTERDGDTDPIILVGRRSEGAPEGGLTVELIETRTDQGLDFLRLQPQVVSCEPAEAGTFEDDTEGLIEIAQGAGSWRLTGSASTARGTSMLNQDS